MRPCLPMSLTGPWSLCGHGQQQGIGQHLEISLLDSLFHLQAPLLGRYFDGRHSAAGRNGSPDYGPYNTYTSRDGTPIQVACFSDKWFENFCQAADRPALLDDARFVTNEKRMENAATRCASCKRRVSSLTRLTVASSGCRRCHPWPVLSQPSLLQGPQIQQDDRCRTSSMQWAPLWTHGLPYPAALTPGQSVGL